MGGPKKGLYDMEKNTCPYRELTHDCPASGPVSTPTLSNAYISVNVVDRRGPASNVAHKEHMAHVLNHFNKTNKTPSHLFNAFRMGGGVSSRVKRKATVDVHNEWSHTSAPHAFSSYPLTTILCHWCVTPVSPPPAFRRVR